MVETRQFSIWETSAKLEQAKSVNDEDERRRHRSRRYRAAYANLKCCCCPCSSPILAGFLIGALIAGIGLATALSIYLVDSRKTTNVILTTTIIFTTATTETTTSVTTFTASTSTTSTATSTSSTASTATSATTTTTTSTTTTAPYCTTRVTFDDIPGQSPTSGVIPNGYNNLNWTNVLYLNASTMPISGYQTAVKSPSFIAYNPGGYTVRIGTANGTRFAFNSIVVTSAWRDSLTWSITGYRAGVNFGTGVFSLQVMNATTVTCGGCFNYDTVYMNASGGTPRSGLAENGTEFAFDDLCISFGY